MSQTLVPQELVAIVDARFIADLPIGVIHGVIPAAVATEPGGGPVEGSLDGFAYSRRSRRHEESQQSGAGGRPELGQRGSASV